MIPRTHHIRTTTALAGITAATLALTSCGAGAGDQAKRDGKITVVASTNVWGSVAQAVGGDSVDVQSVISDPSADPHSYESTPRDAAKVGDADLVLYNGGGYDEFMPKILSSNGRQKPTVQAVDSEQEGAAGHDHEAGGHQEQGHEEQGHEEQGHDHSVNEHVWYDLNAVHGTAEKLADQLSQIQPQKAQQFHDSAAKFTGDVDGLRSRVDQIAQRDQGKKVIVTEPVAHYLIERAKLADITPQSFVTSVESENDPAASAVAEIQNAVNSKQAAAVVYNPQTESPVTENVRKTAERNGTPVVRMTETLPAGQNYVQWMDSQITALGDALK